MNTFSPHILSVRIFGSNARKDADSMSDTDILVIINDHSGKASDEEVLKCLPVVYLNNPNISWYGINRLSKMFQEGHLFAWHLFNESISLFDRNSTFAKLGKPAPYIEALEDIDSFIAVLEGIPESIQKTPSNLVYELGLLYVCLRNISMSASWYFSDTPDFHRYSPFSLDKASVDFTFTKDEYRLCMLARMASQRGTDYAEVISPHAGISLCNRMVLWAYNIRLNIQGNRLCA